MSPASIRDGPSLRLPVLFVLIPALLLLAGCGDLSLSQEQQQEIQAIKSAVAKDPSRVNAPDAAGNPPLHVAVTGGYSALLIWLLDRGADPNGRARDGRTAFHTAVIFDRSPGRSMMKTLLRHGARPNEALGDGTTPLHTAAFLSIDGAIPVLLAAGADSNARTVRGETPLHEAASPQPDKTPDLIQRVIHLLVEGHARVDAQDAAGGSPLHRAAMMGSVPAINALIRENARVDLPDSQGMTPLFRAAIFGQPGAAEALLAGGADVNHRDNRGWTALTWAEERPATSGSGPVDTRNVVVLLKRSGGGT